MGNKVSINYSKVFDTIKILKNMEEIFGKNDFQLSFDNMEEYLNNINYNHDNCLDYKGYFDTIYEDLEYIKKRINDLVQSLSTSSISFINKEELSSKKMDKLLNMFQDTHFINTLKTEVTQVPEVATPSNDGGDINTVPIGIAIGATGVAGAIGAIVVDELYGPKSKQVKTRRVEPEIIEEYHVSPDDDLDEDDYDLEDENYSNNDSVYPVKEEYVAARNHREADRFYGDSSRLVDDSEEYHPSLKEVEPTKKVDLTLEDVDDELSEFDE